MEFNSDTNAISVHGREALNLPYVRWSDDDPATQVQIDLSQSTLYLEIPGAGIRRLMPRDGSDSKSLRIYLSRTEVESLPTVPTPYIIIDETSEDYPSIQLEGKIIRTGYKGAPAIPPSRPRMVR